MSLSILPTTVSPDVERAFAELPERLGGAGRLPFSRAGCFEGHPFYTYGRGARFVAVRDGRPVARAGAYLNPLARTPDGCRAGYVGHFASADDPEAAGALLDAACGWLRRAGTGTAVGPVDYSTWHRYRLAVEGDAPPFLLEPTNPGFYPRLFEAGGFAARWHYRSVALEEPEALLERGRARGAALRPQGFRLRPLRRTRFDAELRLLHELAGESFTANPFFTPCPFEEFRRLYAPLRFVLDPGLLLVAEDASGRPVGFGLGVPDFAPAPGRAGRGVIALPGLLAARRRAGTLVVKTLAVRPALHGLGLGSWLLAALQERALRLGMRRSIHALMSDGNPSNRLAGGAGALLRRYALYERSPG